MLMPLILDVAQVKRLDQSMLSDLKNCHSYRDVNIIILNFILYIIKIYMYTNYKEYENNEKK